ncbi:MAG: PilN domain-containing protein [Actinomycetota bacterium]
MRINLLPPEYLERQRARRRTLAVIAVGLVVLAALGGVYLLQAARLAGVRDDLARQEAANDLLAAQIAELQNVAQLQQEVLANRRLLAQLLVDRVRWSGVLRDVSLVIPGQVWLTGLTGTVAPAAAPAAEPGAAGPGLVAEMGINGFAFEHRDVALWLSRLEDVRGFVNPWLSNSQKTLIGTQQVVQFTSSVDLSEQVLARRGGTS